MRTDEPIGRGRDADVFALDEHRVLRRYRNGASAVAEAEIMAHVAAHGYPVPAVYDAAGADLVLERIDGPTMLAAPDHTSPAVLADLHRRLHAIPPMRSGGSVIHLDLHPDNVMLGPRGPVVIDWRNARDGSPDLDVAVSAVILAEVAVDPTHEFTALAGAFLRGFLHAVGGDPLSALDEAIGMRRANRTLSADEKSRLPAAAALIRHSIG